MSACPSSWLDLGQTEKRATELEKKLAAIWTSIVAIKTFPTCDRKLSRKNFNRKLKKSEWLGQKSWKTFDNPIMTFPINKVSQFLTFWFFCWFCADWKLFCFKFNRLAFIFFNSAGPIWGTCWRGISERIEKVEKKAKHLIGLERMTP